MIDRVLKESIIKRTFDNVTCVMVAFQNFKNVFDRKPLLQNLRSVETMTPTNFNVYTPDIKSNKHHFDMSMKQ